MVTNGSGFQRRSWYGWAAWLLLVLGVVWLGTRPSRSGQAAVAPLNEASCAPACYPARVLDIAADGSSLRVRQTLAPGEPARDLLVGSKELRARLDPAGKADDGVRRGDLVLVTEKAPAPAAGATLGALEVERMEVQASQRWLALAGAALLLILFARVALGKGMAGLILGLDLRMSNSKVQMAVWFGVVMVSYLAALWLRFCYSGNLLLGAVSVPTNLLSLSGLSALTFAGAKTITQSKQNALAAAGMITSMKQPAKQGEAGLQNLVQDDRGHADIGDFQMLLITVVAALTYLVQMFQYLGVLDLHATVSLPDVDSTLLAAFGLGQGAYLAKKAASGPAVPPAQGTPPNAAEGAAPPPGGGARDLASPAPAAPAEAAAAPAADPAGGGVLGVEA